MNFIIKNFLRGLVIVLPISGTVYLLYITFVKIDRLLHLPIPGAGIAVTFTAILLIGILASNFVGRKVLQLTDRLFVRAPLVKIIYSGIKDLIEAFVGDRKRFNRPAIVTLDERGELKALGFVTRDSMAEIGLADHVAVYFPQSYNIAGNLIVMPATRVRPIHVDSSRLMTFIVSGGVSGGTAAVDALES